MRLHRNNRTPQVPVESLHYAARYELIRAHYFQELGRTQQALEAKTLADAHTARLMQEDGQ